MTFSFSSKIIQLDSTVWHSAILIPSEISDSFIKKYGKRCLCSINNTSDLHIALTPIGNQQYALNINQSIQKAYKVKLGDELHLEIKEDTSPYQMEVPIELTEFWKQDEKSKQVFHLLTPGNQRALIHLIAKPKSSNLRIEKTLKIHEYLNIVGSNLDFKELNQALKKS